ncbi:hypothetical protein WJX81_001117 [Elliptochloris bilobata]|uniref:Major facilitator superfamily (MFS) profile domain-containing protein n=1 Tax=Elliptochloris bilobata TaxID=381761 RepID=A0AAW1S3G4_9CHLO
MHAPNSDLAEPGLAQRHSPHRRKARRAWWHLQARHRIIAVCFLATFTAYVERVGFSIAFTAMAKQAGVSEAVKGTVLSAFFWGYAMSQVPGGWAAQQWGGRRTLMASFALWATACLLTPGTADNVAATAAARVAVGVAQGLLIPSIHTVLSQWVPPHERARAVSLATSGMYLGSAGAMLALPGLAAAWGAAALLRGAAGLGFAWLALWTVVGRDVPYRTTVMPLAANEPRGRKGRPPPTPWARLLRHPAVWAIVANNFTFHYAFYVVMNWLPTYFDKVLHANLAQAGVAKTLPYLVMFVTSNAGGWAGDHLIASRRASVAGARKAVNSVGFWCAAGALLLMPAARGEAAGVAATSLALGAAGLARGGFSVNHMDIAPQYAGVVMGISNTAGTLAGVVGVQATGLLLQAAGPGSLAGWTVLPKDLAEVQEVVRDLVRYPSPLVVAGCHEDFERCRQRGAGTVLFMTALSRIVGLSQAQDGASQVVRVEAGVALHALQAWLLARGRELACTDPLPPLGGKATTVGALLAECSVLRPLVHALTFVDHRGRVVRLSREADELALERCLRAHGLLGVMIDATLDSRAASLMRTRIRMLSSGHARRLARRLMALRARCDDLCALVTPSGCYVEQRQELPQRPLARSSPSCVVRAFRRARQRAMCAGGFAWGSALGPWTLLLGVVHTRAALATPGPCGGGPRADVSAYEFPGGASAAEVLPRALVWARVHCRRSGFAPAGFRCRLPPQGSNELDPGFLLEALCADASDPRWVAFCTGFTAWALAAGAAPNLARTHGLVPKQVALDITAAAAQMWARVAASAGCRHCFPGA